MSPKKLKKKENTTKKLLRLSLDEIYYVEKIVGKRVDNGVVKYCVKWKDYDSKDNTWEPIDHLKRYECHELIDDYEHSIAERVHKTDNKTDNKTAKPMDTDVCDTASTHEESVSHSISLEPDCDDNVNNNTTISSIDSISSSDDDPTAKSSDNHNGSDNDNKTDETTRTIEASETGDEQQIDDNDYDMEESAEELDETRKHEDRDDSDESDAETTDDQLLRELKQTINGMNGLRRGFKAKKILGVSDLVKELCFIMTYEDSEIADLVLARDANVACPEVVIDFYQSITVWKSRNEDNLSNQENRALNA